MQISRVSSLDQLCFASGVMMMEEAGKRSVFSGGTALSQPARQILFT